MEKRKKEEERTSSRLKRRLGFFLVKGRGREGGRDAICALLEEWGERGREGDPPLLSLFCAGGGRKGGALSSSRVGSARSLTLGRREFWKEKEEKTRGEDGGDF